MENNPIKKVVIGVLALLVVFFVFSFAGRLGENVDAGEIVIIQDPIDGDLHVYKTPGWVNQNFGTATHYKKSSQFWFSKHQDQGNDVDQSIRVQFKDGGHAQVSGSARVDLPNDDISLISLHTHFGSLEAVMMQLVRPTIEKSVYMTGPLMSSAESYAEKRTDLLAYIEEQAKLGVYKTKTIEKRINDPITGQEKSASVVEIVEVGGNPVRQEISPLKTYNIGLTGLALNSIDYDPTVKKQIEQQQGAIMQVQTSIANAKKSEQEALTAEQNGKAQAAKAKWDQEVIKAKLVTEAQQKFEVQKLATQTSALYKQQQILEGEGEATKKKLLMTANGALEQKLAAWVEERKYAWDAFAKFQGSMVPQFMTGSSGGNANAMTWMETMGMKAMKDLTLDSKNK